MPAGCRLSNLTTENYHYFFQLQILIIHSKKNIMKFAVGDTLIDNVI